MRLIINTGSIFRGGGLQVALSFIEEIKGIKEHEYHIFASPPVIEQISVKSFPNNFHFYDIPLRPGSGIFAFFRMRKLFHQLENRIAPDCVFTTTGPAYWKPKAPHLAGFNLGHFIYPESPYFNLISFRKKLKWVLKKYLFKFIFSKEAGCYVVQTEDVNIRLQKLINNKNVITVSNTYSNHYINYKNFPNKLPERVAGELRFLSLGSPHPHKNISIIKEVIPLLVERGLGEVRFILTIPDKDFEVLFGDKYDDWIHNVGPVKVDEGPSLYRECDYVFLPTLLECFSASYAEAMVMNKPILTSNMGFARTVCEDAALYFNPINPLDIIEKTCLILNDQDLKNRLIERGIKRLSCFNNANERAVKYLDICKKIQVSGGED